jgi:hypothetical protein
MSDFSSMIVATGETWTVAKTELDKITPDMMKDTSAFSKALLEAQMKIGIATSVENKTSSAIDKAYQAHGQVASK